ncbi:MAG: 50S ribosomal protein L23 [Gammaproteobacteria bacterium]|nr:MAG: 50S ribosomal protein L23 [Gammaproteobacteria bacterium]
MNEERLLQVLIAPHVSEKAAALADSARQHVFRVRPDADKREIKRAVELLFGVEVESVRVLNVRGKRKTFRGRPGRRTGYKKAYVRLAEGHDISYEGGE